ncbi:MAG: AAA family ATPase [Candidatus Paceibacterota bacterium]
MQLKSIEIAGFKSFAKKSTFEFSTSITAIVGPNGSGKSNVAEAFRFVLGEQSMKSLRGKRGEDLIWSGSESSSRANRASGKVVFDNEKRLLDVDFDEVMIERVVHRDGANQYLINGSQVRLRDVIELLAGANVGATGHHIISQGEADRILSANPKERREMIEDALGLKVYQYKKQESEKKLVKTEENIAQVASLRREIAPHLKFLSKQVQKVEEAMELKKTLTGKYRDYFLREDCYIRENESLLKKEKESPEKELAELEEKLQGAKRVLEETKGEDEDAKHILSLEGKLALSRERRETLSRKLGRLEGEIVARKSQQSDEEDTEGKVPLSVVEDFTHRLGREIAEGETSPESALSRIKRLLSDFLSSIREKNEGGGKRREELREKEEEFSKLKDEERLLLKKDEELKEEYESFRLTLEGKRQEGREAEREVFRIMTKQNELRSALSEMNGKSKQIEWEKDEYKRDISEVGMLLGRAVLDFSHEKIQKEEVLAEDRVEQRERKRELERMKIRLEELGGSSADDVVKEYKEVSERDQFLARETEDLENSKESLRRIILELDEKLDIKFKEGLTRINLEFQQYFSLMFGGGKAELLLLREEKKRANESSLISSDEEVEEGKEILRQAQDTQAKEGIDISVSLPRKKIKGLMMLSGGERALTSIALIFAMSGVNPPPFLILDETDAALDEANSRRYGDMIETLSKKSQLILITHNRETMSRAGILYGVTMGGDGISKVLSVRFEEALQVAK